MVKLYDSGVWLVNGRDIVEDGPEAAAAIGQMTGSTAVSREEASKETMAYSILEKHNTSGNMDDLQIKFDKLTSHDITFVGIIQTARASGLEKFPIPYVLTNCHNSLCAVGGTINEDDHMFGLTCAKKYGGMYVPPHQAVIHQFAREMLAGAGKMILGSDSHTRYGALGTMAMGEGGPDGSPVLFSGFTGWMAAPEARGTIQPLFLSLRGKEKAVDGKKKGAAKGDFDFPLCNPLKTTKKGAAAPFLGFSPGFGLYRGYFRSTKRDADAY